MPAAKSEEVDLYVDLKGTSNRRRTPLTDWVLCDWVIFKCKTMLQEKRKM